MANSYTFLANLRAGRCSNTAEVRLLRFWEARNINKGGELMSIELLLIDEAVSVLPRFNLCSYCYSKKKNWIILPTSIKKRWSFSLFFPDLISLHIVIPRFFRIILLTSIKKRWSFTNNLKPLSLCFYFKLILTNYFQYWSVLKFFFWVNDYLLLYMFN